MVHNLGDLDSIMKDIDESSNHTASEQDGSLEQITEPSQPEDSESHDSEASGINGIMSIEQYQRIGYDKFEAVDLRVAKILNAEVHPSTRKPMYKLTLDLGELGRRTIVAGIGAFYGREELIGKKIVVVANLAPRTIAGVVSDGMLLAAEDGLNVSLIVPDKDAEPGSKIH